MKWPRNRFWIELESVRFAGLQKLFQIDLQELTTKTCLVAGEID